MRLTGWSIHEWTLDLLPGTVACPRISRPSAKACGKSLVGSAADAGKLETDLQSERAHDEVAGREAAKPLGQAGFRLISTFKEDEPWLGHVAVPAGQGVRPVLHQVREGQELGWWLRGDTLRVPGFRRGVFRQVYLCRPGRGVNNFISQGRTLQRKLSPPMTSHYPNTSQELSTRVSIERLEQHLATLG